MTTDSYTIKLDIISYNNVIANFLLFMVDTNIKTVKFMVQISECVNCFCKHRRMSSLLHLYLHTVVCVSECVCFLCIVSYVQTDMYTSLPDFSVEFG